MLNRKRLWRAGLPALTGAAMLASGQAYAAATVSITAGTQAYAAEGISSSSTVTVPTNITVTGTYVLPTALAPRESIGPNAVNVTLTLSSGATWAAVPAVQVSNNNCFAGNATISGSVLNIPVVYTNNTAAAIPAGNQISCTLTIGNLVGNTVQNGITGILLNNAQTLSTPNNTLTVTEATNGSDPAGQQMWNPASGGGSTATLARSQSALIISGGNPSTNGFGSLSIDVAPPALGTQFLQNGVDTYVGDLGSITLGTANVLGSNGAPFSFNSNATLTMTGNFNGITAAYIAPQTSPATTTCSATAPSNAFTGTVTATSITFNNVTIPANPASSSSTSGSTTISGQSEVCLIANNNGQGTRVLIGANPGGVSLRASLSGITSSNVGGLLLTFNYNGSVQQILYSGSFTAYPMFLRLTNNTGGTVTPVVVVQVDPSTSGGAGGQGTATLSNLAPNQNVLTPVSSIVTSSGVTLTETGRVSLFVMTKGATCNNNSGGIACTVSVKQLLQNPNGTIVDLGSGQAP